MDDEFMIFTGASLLNRTLRPGFTTGACAAAAAKAAALHLLTGKAVGTVEIPLPDKTRACFDVFDSCRDGRRATATVIKDAGDDPDVTNGAEIVVTVRLDIIDTYRDPLIKGGPGVGIVTKPGLALAVGERAINPVPREMIREALDELGYLYSGPGRPGWELLISVPRGETLAKKTVNARLGIMGGISILGTTGRVVPISAEAWGAAIVSQMNVARAMGREEVCLSTGRTSERAHQRAYALPIEAYVMMGDYLEFSLRAAGDMAFRRIHLAAQWAKLLKIAMGIPHTHVRFGMLDIRMTMTFLTGMGYSLDGRFHTAREILTKMEQGDKDKLAAMVRAVCRAAKAHAEAGAAGTPVTVHLVSYEGRIIGHSD